MSAPRRRIRLTLPAVAALGAVLVVAPLGGAPEAEAAPSRTAPAQILVVTATAGFRHRSRPAAVRALTLLGARNRGYRVVHSNNLKRWSPAYLRRFDAIVFANTSGELPLSPQQRGALIRFVRSGGGFIGLHSASDTFHRYRPYQRMLGARFRDHPYSSGVLRRVGPRHPATVRMPRTRRLSREEIYRFRGDPRATGKRILLRLDPATVPGAAPGEFLPIAWCGRFGTGRVFYNALGHHPRTWRSGWFRRHLDGAISWAAGRRAPGACPRA